MPEKVLGRQAMAETEESASNETGGDSALAKKVKCASFDVTIYPHLERLAGFLSKTCAAALATAAKTDVKPKDPKIKMQDAQLILSGLPEQTVYYWFGEQHCENAMLVSLSPSFVSGLSEALLGNEFVLNDDASPSPLDSEMAQLFVLELAEKVNVCLAECLGDAQAGGLAYKSVCSVQEKILKNLQTSALFSVGVDFKFPDSELISALAFYFPIEFLEHKGMLAQSSKAAISLGEYTQWYADMLSNINNTEVDLPIVIGEYKMTLSDLSKLKVEQLIPLEENAHNAMNVTLKTKNTSLTLCQGRLGTYKKNKAVKIVSEVGVY